MHAPSLADTQSEALLHQTPTMALVAGETSGDWIGSLVVKGVQQYASQPIKLEGIAGHRLQADGVIAMFSSEELAVRGYVEVLKHYRKILGIRNSIKAHWLNTRPGVFMGIDAPDFNLQLECDLRQAGIRTVHLVCPSFWAWRPKRINLIKQACEHVLCVFPFEPALLAKAGVSATYIGHPLASLAPLDVNTQAARQSLNIDADVLIAVLPGSRGSEIKYIGPTLVETVRQLMQQNPHWHFVTPLVQGPAGERFRAMVPANLRERWHLLQGQSHEAMAASDFVVLASGTATLEAALYKKPMVITYKMPALSYWLMKRTQTQPYVGLPNILAGEGLVPECLQNEATPENLAREVMQWMRNEAQRAQLTERFTQMHHSLIRDTGKLASEILLPMLEGTT
jgi:lipid-A-disaccharide synthase